MDTTDKNKRASRKDPIVDFTGLEQKSKTYTISLYRGDELIVQQLLDFLGCTRSELFRTAVRAYAMHLGYTQGFSAKRDGTKLTRPGISPDQP